VRAGRQFADGSVRRLWAASRRTRGSGRGPWQSRCLNSPRWIGRHWMMRTSPFPCSAARSTNWAAGSPSCAEPTPFGSASRSASERGWSSRAGSRRGYRPSVQPVSGRRTRPSAVGDPVAHRDDLPVGHPGTSPAKQYRHEGPRLMFRTVCSRNVVSSARAMPMDSRSGRAFPTNFAILRGAGWSRVCACFVIAPLARPKGRKGRPTQSPRSR
jgi:hypothetical protein